MSLSSVSSQSSLPSLSFLPWLSPMSSFYYLRC